MISRRILVIDDRRDAVVSTQRVLEMSGHEVQVAYDGASGIELAGTFRPEVVLCDIGLPGELDGYGVAQSLRGDKRFQSLFLIAVTGYGRDEDAARAREAGFDLHLTKPVDVIALADKITERFAVEQ